MPHLIQEVLSADGLGHQTFSRSFALRFEGSEGTIIISLDDRISDSSVEDRFVERAVSQGLLQGGDRHPCIEESGRVRVAQAMRAEADAESLPPALEPMGNARRGQRTAALDQEMIAPRGLPHREISAEGGNRP